MSSRLHSVVAQDTAPPRINVSAISNDLRVELENVLDKQGETKNIRMLTDHLVIKLHQLSDIKLAERILY